jgi:outer membrane protein TolC
MRHAFLLLITFDALCLGGCTAFSPDGGFTPVADAARQRLGQEVAWPRNPDERAKADAQAAALLKLPLSPENAVQIALLNNRALQASFEEIGISEADLVQAGRLQNPRFDLRHAGAAGQYDVEETLSFNVLALLTMPYTRAAEKRRFAQVQSAAVLQVAQLAEGTREAYYTAAAAQASLLYGQHIQAAADTGAILAKKMLAAGNWNRIDQAREQAFYEDAADGLLRARLAEESAREKLLTLMGLDAGAAGPPAAPAAPPEQALPELPARIDELPEVEGVILQNRLDLQLMRQRIEELKVRLKLTRSTRFVNVLDAGATRVRQGSKDAPYEWGYTLTLEVPLFDSGDARLRKSEALYAQAVDRFTQAAIAARSQIRLAYGNYRAAYELARRQRDDVLPMARAVSQENLLRYNGAQIGIFELLSDAREQMAANARYIERLRDFWIAKSRLDGALLGSSPISAGI